jgi:NTP pyrophosphatase (non-canonical NTP hydrolase)
VDIEKIIEALRKFRDDREWSQFHNSKDLALAISIEAAELLELFLWKNPEEADIQKIKEELADVFIFSMFLADKYGLNVSEIINEKLASNSRKYPIDKAKGSAKKYNEL